jgi:hypothetical protein
VTVGRRYSVVRTHNGTLPGKERDSLGGIFRHLTQATKECARRNERDRLVHDPKYRGAYQWRVLDLGARALVA